MAYFPLTEQQEKFRQSQSKATLPYSISFDAVGNPTYTGLTGASLEIAKSHNILGVGARGVITAFKSTKTEGYIQLFKDSTCTYKVFDDHTSTYRDESCSRGIIFDGDGVTSEHIAKAKTGSVIVSSKAHATVDNSLFQNYQQDFNGFVPGAGVKCMLVPFYIMPGKTFIETQQLKNVEKVLWDFTNDENVEKLSLLQQENGRYIHNNVIKFDNFEFGGFTFSGTIHEVLEYDAEGNVKVVLLEGDNPELLKFICTIPFYSNPKGTQAIEYNIYIGNLLSESFGSDELALAQKDFQKMHQPKVNDTMDMTFAMLDLDASFLAKGLLGEQDLGVLGQIGGSKSAEDKQAFYELNTQVLEIRQEFHKIFFNPESSAAAKEKVLLNLTLMNRELCNFQKGSPSKGVKQTSRQYLEIFLAQKERAVIADNTKNPQLKEILTAQQKLLDRFASAVDHIDSSRQKIVSLMLQVLDKILNEYEKQDSSKENLDALRSQFEKLVKQLEPQSFFGKLLYRSEGRYIHTHALISGCESFLASLGATPLKPVQPESALMVGAASEKELAAICERVESLFESPLEKAVPGSDLASIAELVQKTSTLAASSSTFKRTHAPHSTFFGNSGKKAKEQPQPEKPFTTSYRNW